MFLTYDRLFIFRLFTTMKPIFHFCLTVNINSLSYLSSSCESCSPATGFALIGLAQLIFGQCLIQLHVVIDQWAHGILDITSLLPPAVTIPSWTRNRAKNKEQRNCQHTWKQTTGSATKHTGIAQRMEGNGNFRPSIPVSRLKPKQLQLKVLHDLLHPHHLSHDLSHRLVVLSALHLAQHIS